jgi:hypothetical protein
MHKTLKEIRAYAARLEEMTGVARLCFKIPEGSEAYLMGYRFATCREDERDDYATDGAVFV